jgi:hypothetical protein
MSDILKGLLQAVDEQLRSPQTPYVKATYDRLRASGMNDEQTREEIADCLGEELDEMLRQNRGFDETLYKKMLEALPWNEEPDTGNDLDRL